MDMKTQFLDYSGLGEAVNLIKKYIADHKEILPYASLGSFPKIGNEDCLYIDISSGLFYRWNTNGKQYILLGGKSVKEVSIESGSTNGTIKLIVDGVKTDNIAIKGLGAAAFIDNYAGSTVPGGPAINAMDIASQTPILAVGDEQNNISVKKNTNGTFMNGEINVEVNLSVNGKALNVDGKTLTVAQSNTSDKYAMRNALDFAWYKTHWQIGNVRSNAEDSIGFGFAYSNDEGEHFIPKALLSDSGQFTVDSLKANIILGDLSGNATSASKAPWSGVTGKPDSMPASDVFPWAKEATKPTYTYVEVGAAPLEHNHDDLYYTEAEITAFLDKKANIEHNHDSVYYTQTKINELLLQKSDFGHKHAKGDVGLSNVDNTADKDKVVKSAASADAVAWINVLNKPDSYTPSAHGHTIAEITSLQTSLDSKSNINHTHDDRYFTETETTNLLKNYMPIGSTVSWSKLTDVPKTFTPSEHTHNYAASSSAGGAATSALMISAQTPILASGNESNDISVKQNANGTFTGRSFKLDVGIALGGKVISIGGRSVVVSKPMSASAKYALRNALDFKYYSSHWQIGNVRANSNESIGFGFAYSDDGTTYYPKAILTTAGVLSIETIRANRFEGRLYGTASSADSVTWAAITGKPATYTPSIHNHNDLYYTKTQMDDKLSGKSDTDHTHDYLPLSGGSITGAVNFLDDYNNPTINISSILGYLDNGETNSRTLLLLYNNIYKDGAKTSSYTARIGYSGNKNVNLEIPDKSGVIAVTDDIPATYSWDSILDKPDIYNMEVGSTSGGADFITGNTVCVNNNLIINKKLEIKSNVKVNGGLNTQNLVPAADSTYFIGTSNQRYYGYFTRIHTDSIIPNSTGQGSIGSTASKFSNLYVNNIGSSIYPCNSISSASFSVPTENGGSSVAFISSRVKNSCQSGYIYLKYDQGITYIEPCEAKIGTINITLPSVSGELQVSTSDIRMKDNIHDSTINALNLIDKIKMRQFDWRTDHSHQDIGFIADELEQLDSRLATSGSDELDENGFPKNPKCVNDFYLMGYMVKAMQEMSQKITELENKLNRKEMLSC